MASHVYRKPLDIGRAGQVVINLIMIVLTLIFILPVILIVIISFSGEDSLNEIGYSFFPLTWSVKAYKYFLTTNMASEIFNSYLLSVTVTVVGTFLSVLITTLFAFALSRKSFKLRSPLSFFIFFTMLFNGGIVSSYIVNTKYLHLGNTFYILVLPSLFSAYNAIILRTFMTSSVPDSLIESGKIDGASEWTIFFKIAVPLSKPGIATIGLFNVIGYWNEWFTGLMYITNPKLVTLQYMLMKILNNIQFIKDNSRLAMTAEGREMLNAFPSEAGRMALLVIVMAPILFVYPFFQKYFIKGLTLGSIKG